MPRIKDVCLVMVTFFPSAKTFSNISHIAKCWPELQVSLVDNTNSPNDQGTQSFFSRLLLEYPAIHILRNNRNLGIAAALNQGAEYANSHAFQWRLTVDQDTKLDPAYFSEINRLMEYYPGNKPIAVVGVNYCNLTTGKLARPRVAKNSLCEAKAVITSGSLVSIRSWIDIGGYCEPLFIDMVDTEYCFRARQKGCAVVFVNTPLMQHEIGFRGKIGLGGYDVFFFLLSPFRQYYIFRNMIYMIKHYCGYDLCWSIKMLFVEIPKLLCKAILGRRRKKSLHNILRGIRDGVNSNFAHNPLEREGL